jgi:hypothetical protein
MIAGNNTCRYETIPARIKQAVTGNMCGYETIPLRYEMIIAGMK